MNHVVYVIRGRDGEFYKGVTTYLRKRLRYHNAGLSRWTKGRGPFTTIHTKEFDSKAEALRYEKFLKSGKGREFIKATYKKDVTT